MDRDELFEKAVAIGQQKADEAIAARKLADQRRAVALQAASQTTGLQPRVIGAGPLAAPHAATLGFLVAAGDSWFDYPFHNVLTQLHDLHGYNVESTAANGDPMEAMAYVGGQIDGLSRMFSKVAASGATPKAVLLSGGGDDVAGKEFGMLLNNKNAQIEEWNEDVLTGVIDNRIASAYRAMIAGVDRLSDSFAGKKLPILFHGYDYPVPDGRGFLGGFGPLPGPWLQPGFREKNYENLQETIDLMKKLIDRFNVMAEGVATGDDLKDHVHYIDLRGTLSTDLTNDLYKQWWANELHPTENGFEKVTERFAGVLQKL